MIMGGTSANQPAAAKTPMQTRKVTIEARKPIMTAVGDFGKTVGMSSAGREPGRSFWEIPRKAGTISAKNIRTP